MIEPVYSPAHDRYACGMKYRRAGRSGIFLPEISLGLWHNFGDVDTLANGKRILFRAFDRGVTHFDLANNYGPSDGSAEETFGHVMKSSFMPYRDEMFISTKAGHDMWTGPYGTWNSRKHLMASLDQSLKRMNLDYIDVFYSHRYDPETHSMLVRDPEKQGVLTQAKANGVGFIAFSPLAEGLLTNRYLNGIPEDSRIARGGHLKKEALTDKVLHQIQVLNALALRRGQTLAEMALAWLLKDELVTSVIIGASSVGQLDDNLKALGNTCFSEEELREIEAVLVG